MDKQVIVFFEGCDMVGKTQIAQEVSRRTGVKYFKASSEHGAFLTSKSTKDTTFINQLRYADPRVFDLLKQTGHSVVFDRGFPSEYVYSQVLKRDTDVVMLQHMDEMWASLGAKVILCYRNDYTNIVDDIDPSIDASMLRRLTDAYFKWADTVTKCQVLRLCVDDEDLDREASEVLTFLGV